MAAKRKLVGRSYVVHPNVSRIEYPGDQGYRVRFSQRDDQGVARTKTKSFSDAVHGKRQARVLAIAWREEYAESLKRERPSRAEPPGYGYVKKMRVSNNSQGVRHHYLAYVGFLRIEERKHLSTRWSIEKWGAKIAKTRCERWLKKKTQELKVRLRAAKASASVGAGTRQSTLPPPLIKLTKRACKECGGPIFRVTGPGRVFEYRPNVTGAIPSDFATNTCGKCGEHYLTANEYEDLCNLMLKRESLAPKKAKARRKARSRAA